MLQYNVFKVISIVICTYLQVIQLQAPEQPVTLALSLPYPSTQLVSSVRKIMEFPNSLSFCSVLLLDKKISRNKSLNNGHSSVSAAEASPKFYELGRDQYVITIGNSNTSTSSTASQTVNAIAIKHPIKQTKRFGENCVVSLIFIPDVKSHFEGSTSTSTSTSESESGFSLILEKMLDIITLPNISPLTKRNEDFYLFITSEPETMNKVLLSNHISSRITHKIAITTKKTIDKNMRNKVDTAIQIKTMCFYCDHGLPKLIPVTEDEIEMFLRDNFPSSKFLKNFNKAIIGASVVSVGPTTQLRLIDGKLHPYLTGGSFLRNFVTTSESLNFTYDIRRGGGVGLRTKNGTWSGIVGDVLYRRAHIGVVCGITAERFDLVEFSAAFEYYVLTFAHGPTTSIYTWKTVFWPLSPMLWYFILSSIIVSLIFLRGVHLTVDRCFQDIAFHHKEEDQIPVVVPTFRFFNLQSSLSHQNQTKTMLKVVHRPVDDHKPNIWTFPQSVFFILPSFVNQHFIKTKTPTLQVFSVGWVFFSIVISTVYLSKLYGIFVDPPVEEAPKSFGELADSNYDIGMTYFGGAIFTWFQKASADTADGKIFKRWEKRKTIDCLLATMDKNRKYACISYRSSIKHTIQAKLGDKYGQSKIIVEPAVAFEFPISLITERRSILIQSINRVTSSNFECGLSGYWNSKTHTEIRMDRFRAEKEKGIISAVNSDGNEPVRLKTDNLLGAFSVLACGLILAGIGFAGEWVWTCIYRWIPKRNHAKLMSALHYKMKILATNNHWPFNKIQADNL